MKPIHFLIAGAAALASAGCNAEQQQAGGSGSSSTASGPIEPVQRPANGDWSQAVTPTAEGGFLMGSPDAAVKVVEFSSMTCPHCRTFDETAMEPLTQKYVKDGRVSFEMRNFVTNPYDITASLIARCNGAKSFYPLTHALFKDQPNWIQKLQGVSPDQLATLETMGPDQQFLTIAQWAGFQQWAAMRGVPTAKSTQCLTDKNEINKLVEMNANATEQYNIPGTPSFLINGKLVDQTSTWETLEPKIREALGERG